MITPVTDTEDHTVRGVRCVRARSARISITLFSCFCRTTQITRISLYHSLIWCKKIMLECTLDCNGSNSRFALKHQRSNTGTHLSTPTTHTCIGIRRTCERFLWEPHVHDNVFGDHHHVLFQAHGDSACARAEDGGKRVFFTCYLRIA